MAKTHGHGNPNWTRDETILALALYFECGRSIPSSLDLRVRDLSELLRRLPYHANASRKPSFRNADGVAFKLQNIHNVATGKGLGNVSAMDRQIWAEFAARSGDAIHLAERIKAGLRTAETLSDEMLTERDEEFFEGRLLTQLHKYRERDPKVRKRLLEMRREAGNLSCDLCNQRHPNSEPEYEDAIFEVHHTMPIGMATERVTRLSEIALVCANCHRLIHRAMTINKRNLTLAECSSILSHGVTRKAGGGRK